MGHAGRTLATTIMLLVGLPGSVRHSQPRRKMRSRLETHTRDLTQMETGCEAYLSKPVPVAQFIETIRRFIGG
jgi:hypothetical protein